MELEDEEAQVERLLRETRPRGRQAGRGSADPGDDGEAQTESESDIEIVQPPRELHKTANEVTGKHISHAEFGKAWDATRHVIDLDKRSSAVLEKLLHIRGDAVKVDKHTSAGSPEKEISHTAATARSVRDSPSKRSASPTTKAKTSSSKTRASENLHSKPKDPIIDLSISSDSEGKPRAKHEHRSSKHKRKREKSEELPEIPIAKKRERMEVDKDGHRRGKTTAKGKQRAQSVEIVEEDENLVEGLERNRATAFIDTSAEPSSGSTSTTPETKAQPAAGPATIAGPYVPLAGPSTDIDEARPLPAAIVEEPVSSLAQVLSMVPDVETGHAQGLIAKFEQFPNCVEYVIDALFNDGNYPKVAKVQAKLPETAAKGKGKTTNSASEELDSQVAKYMDYDKRGTVEGTPSGEYREAA